MVHGPKYLNTVLCLLSSSPQTLSYTVCIKRLRAHLRAGHAVPTFVEHVGLNHGRADVPVNHPAERAFDAPNVVTVLQQMRRERMTEGMAASAFDDPGLADRFLCGPLNDHLA